MPRRYRLHITRSSQNSGSSYTLEPPLHTIPSGIDAETMAEQTITYMNVLREHGAAIRTCPRSEGAYQRIIDEGRVLPPGTRWPSLDNQRRDDLRRRMETIIHGQATTAEEHLEICSAANTLLLLQHDILNRLPYPECRKIEKRTNELRAARRRQLAQGKGRFRGLARPPPLSPIERPDPDVKPQKIRLIGNVEISSDGLHFGVQSEGNRIADTIGLDDLKDLLERSAVISTELNSQASSNSK